MKTFMPYLLLFGGLMVLSTGAVTALLVFKPELFGPGNEMPQIHAASADRVQRTEAVATAMRDSAAVPPGAMRDTANSFRGGKEKAGQEETAQVRDSVGVLVAERERTRKQPEDTSRQPVPPLLDTAVATDSVKVKHYKNIAKVLEAMPPESAARILEGLPDNEVRVLLLNIKKRQAAKILAAIEPSRASQLVR